MNVWNGSTAVITGAGSGIGLALSEALISRGAEVWLTDINGASVAEAADRLGPKAHFSELDVCRAAAVKELVDRVAKDSGKIDFMFNNAGIGMGGEMHELVPEHFDRVIDINLRGVLHGVAAAYPHMVKQGAGHIVNTASLAGLLPMPLSTPYSMTKHAIVGLSTSLRIEAETLGVKVSALCPGMINTPFLDQTQHAEVPPVWHPQIRRSLDRSGVTPNSVTDLVDDAIRGIERNQGLIVAPRRTRMVLAASRLFPRLWKNGARRNIESERAERLKNPGENTGSP